MKIDFKLFVLLSLLALLSSCRENKKPVAPIVGDARKVEKFTSIELSDGIVVRIIKGDSQMITVYDYSNFVENISVVVKNGTLYIKTIPASINLENSKAEVVIVTPDVLKSVEISGSGNIEIPSEMTMIESFEVSGSGSIIAQTAYYAKNLSIEISGSGNVEAKGAVSHLEAEISGSGSIDAQYLIATTVNCDISGSGDITTYATEKLDADISGSGDITYYGNPRLNANGSGSGDFVKK